MDLKKWSARLRNGFKLIMLYPSGYTTQTMKYNMDFREKWILVTGVSYYYEFQSPR